MAWLLLLCGRGPTRLLLGQDMSYRFDDFIPMARSSRIGAQHVDNLLSFGLGVKQPYCADTPIGTDFVDVKFFHMSLIGLRSFVADLLALSHERFISFGVRLH